MINWILRKVERRWIVRHDHPDERKLRAWYKKYNDIAIGKYTYGLWGAEIAPKTKIGAFCSIAPNVKIGLMNHPMEYVSTHPFLYYKDRGFVKEDIQIPQKSAPIIDDDVWIGTNVVILPRCSYRTRCNNRSRRCCNKGCSSLCLCRRSSCKVVKIQMPKRNNRKAP